MMLEGGIKYLQVDPEARSKAWQEWNRPSYWPIALLLLALLGAIVYAIRWNLRSNV